MSNLTKPQRKQLERQISDAQQKLRQDDIKKCLDRRSKAIMKAISRSSVFTDSICDDLINDKYSNAAIEQAFYVTINMDAVLKLFRKNLQSISPDKDVE